MIQKFRVWDKRRKEFRTDIYVDCIGQIFQSSKFTPFGKTITFINDENIEISQSTGLFDKNRVEIYEGDIVIDKIGDPLPMVVKWDDAGFRTFGKYNGENYVGYVGHTDRYENNTCTVIGNIYENKELDFSWI